MRAALGCDRRSSRTTRAKGAPGRAERPEEEDLQPWLPLHSATPSLIPTRAQTLLLNQTPHRPVTSLLEYPSLLWPLDTPLLPSSTQNHFPEVWTLSCMDPWRGRGWREGLGTILLLSQPRGMLGSSTAKWKSKPTKSRPQTFEALPRCRGMIGTLTLLQLGLSCLPAWRSQPERSQSMPPHLPRAMPLPTPQGSAPSSPRTVHPFTAWSSALSTSLGQRPPHFPGQCPPPFGADPPPLQGSAPPPS